MQYTYNMIYQGYIMFLIYWYTLKVIGSMEANIPKSVFGLWCLRPFSTVFPLYRGIHRTLLKNKIMHDISPIPISKKQTSNILMILLVVFSATFNNISVILWQSVLLIEETGVPGENHRPVASH